MNLLGKLCVSVAFLVAFAIGGGESIECIKCDSATNLDCLSPDEDSTFSADECDTHETVCVMAIKNESNGRKRMYRGCGREDLEISACEEFSQRIETTFDGCRTCSEQKHYIKTCNDDRFNEM